MTMWRRRICSIRCSETILIRSNPVELKPEELAALILLISLMIFTLIFVVVMKIFSSSLYSSPNSLCFFSFPLPCIAHCWNTLCTQAKQHAQLQLSNLVMLQVVLMKEKNACIRQNAAYIHSILHYWTCLIHAFYKAEHL